MKLQINGKEKEVNVGQMVKVTHVDLPFVDQPYYWEVRGVNELGGHFTLRKHPDKSPASEFTIGSVVYLIHRSYSGQKKVGASVVLGRVKTFRRGKQGSQHAVFREKC